MGFLKNLDICYLYADIRMWRKLWPSEDAGLAGSCCWLAGVLTSFLERIWGEKEGCGEKKTSNVKNS